MLNALTAESNPSRCTKLISLRQDATLRPPVHPQLPNSTDTRRRLHLWRPKLLSCLSAREEAHRTIDQLPPLYRQDVCMLSVCRWQMANGKTRDPSSPSGDPASHIQTAIDSPLFNGTSSSTSASHQCHINIVQRRLVLSGPCLAPKGPKNAQKRALPVESLHDLDHPPNCPENWRPPLALLLLLHTAGQASTHPLQLRTWSAQLLLGTARDQS